MDGGKRVGAACCNWIHDAAAHAQGIALVLILDVLKPWNVGRTMFHFQLNLFVGCLWAVLSRHSVGELARAAPPPVPGHGLVILSRMQYLRAWHKRMSCSPYPIMSLRLFG